MKNDLHSLFDHQSKNSFHDNIKIQKASKDKLREAAKEIMGAIKSAFANPSKGLIEALPFSVPTPFFAIQGSFGYGTLIQPASSSQQIDLDLGLYLPFSILNNGSSTNAVVNAYFSIIESCLESYISEQGKSWKLLKGRTKKDTCVRVELDGSAHIDVPLYGYPEEHAKIMGQTSITTDRKALLESARIEDIYSFDRLIESEIGRQPTQIHIAIRDKGWEPSNPIILGKFIKTKLKDLGPNSRAIARYVKAWRDVTWPDGGGPSSLYMLILTLDSINSVMTRHCELVSCVAVATEQVLDRPLLVPCPTEENPESQENLNKRLSAEDIDEIRLAFSKFRLDFEKAKSLADSTEANNELIDLFGDRVPFDPIRIKELDQVTNSVEKTVLSAPIIKRTTKSPTITTAG